MSARLMVALVLALGLNHAVAEAGASKSPGRKLQEANSAADNETGILSKEIQQMLDAGGYADAKILQETLLIEAKDKNGNPVLLQIGGNSMTVVPIGRPQATENHSLPPRQAEAKSSSKDASSKTQKNVESIPTSSPHSQKQIDAMRRSPFQNPASSNDF
jgi:hypothetical protein